MSKAETPKHVKVRTGLAGSHRRGRRAAKRAAKTYRRKGLACLMTLAMLGSGAGAVVLVPLILWGPL